VLNEIAALKPILEERFRQIAEKEIAEDEARYRSMQKPESSPHPLPPLQQTYVPYENWNLAEQLKDLPPNKFISNNSSYVKIFYSYFLLLNQKFHASILF
jgi:hypothetical protein